MILIIMELPVYITTCTSAESEKNMKTERFLKVAIRYTEGTGYLREDEYDDAHSQTHDNQAEEKYIFKNSVKEHYFLWKKVKQRI